MIANHTRSPSSSPPASPFPRRNSSPPPSPACPAPFVIHEHPPPRALRPAVAHPFAGCNKAVYSPVHPPCDDSDGDDHDVDHDGRRVGDTKPTTWDEWPDAPLLCTGETRVRRAREGYAAHARPTSMMAVNEMNERAIWDEAIANVVDNGHGKVELSGRGLTIIPPQISELAHFVAIPMASERHLASTFLHTKDNLRSFRRSTTAPANIFSSRSTIAERTISTMESTVGFAREELQLFLSSNRVSAIPPQLFHLDRLTVLSLRFNNLTSLPPAIAKLAKLRELHISNNHIKYLPAEMLSMTLTCLSLFPNPFLREGDVEMCPSNEGDATSTRPVSATTVVNPHARIPELTELCLRVLISPASAGGKGLPASETEVVNLTYHYGPSLLPDPPPLGYGISAPFVEVLNACVPGSVTVAETLLESAEELQARHGGREAVSGIGFCSSPRHAGGKDGLGRFVRHEEERFTWESVIGGVKVGGRVPVRWRGCGLGCLDWLDPGETRGAHGDDVGVEDMSDVVTLVPVSFGEDGLDAMWED